MSLLQPHCHVYFGSRQRSHGLSPVIKANGYLGNANHVFSKIHARRKLPFWQIVLEVCITFAATLHYTGVTERLLTPPLFLSVVYPKDLKLSEEGDSSFSVARCGPKKFPVSMCARSK